MLARPVIRRAPRARSVALTAVLAASLATPILIAPALVAAQAAGHVHTPGMSHDSATAAQRPKPTRAGNEAFATIAEVVRILEADPRTDWTKVDIEALRQHLIDMDDVTIRSVVTSTPIDGGVQFDVRGTGRIRDAVRRMALAHGATITPADGFSWTAVATPAGARVTVKALRAGDAAMTTRLRALGFLGVLSLGDHHVTHHIGIADGSMREAHHR